MFSEYIQASHILIDSESYLNVLDILIEYYKPVKYQLEKLTI